MVLGANLQADHIAPKKCTFLRAPAKRKTTKKARADVLFRGNGVQKDGFAILSDGFELADRCFAEQNYHFSSLFSFLFSLEKVAEGNGEKSEERREKSEENKKKKPLTRLFLFGGGEGNRTPDPNTASVVRSRETRLHTPKSRCQNRFALRLFMILTFLVRSRRILFRHSRGKNPRARTAKIRLSPVKSLNHIDGKAFHTGLAVLFRGCILQLFSVSFRFSPFVRHLSAVAHSFFIYDA